MIFIYIRMYIYICLYLCLTYDIWYIYHYMYTMYFIISIFPKNKDCRSWLCQFPPSFQVDLPTDQGFCCLLRPFQGHATRRAAESTFGTAGCWLLFFCLDKKSTGMFTSWNGTLFFGGWDQTIQNIQIYGNFWEISLVTMMVPLGWGPLYKQSFFRGLQQRGLNS